MSSKIGFAIYNLLYGLRKYSENLIGFLKFY